jgi:hypothetical protein
MMSNVCGRGRPFLILLALLSCSTLTIAQGTGRRLSGQPGAPVQPEIQTVGCPNGQDIKAPTEPLSAGDYVELQRTQCFGSCPVYKVRVYADGQVAWSGTGHVQVVGEKTGQITSEAARSLIDQFRAAGFWNLCQSYTRMVTDFPTAIAVVHVANSEKSVSDRAQGAPDWLRELDRTVDAVADTYAWIHGDPRLEMLPSLLSDARGPKPGLTALMQAAGRGDLAEVGKLLSGNANINAQDSSGATAVIYATQAANPELLRVLLRAGADPNIRTYTGQTATMAASVCFRLPEEKLRILFAAGTDVNAQDLEGQTALMLAVRYQFERPEVADVIVQLGARRDITDGKGLSALDRLEKDPRRSKLPAPYERLRQLLQPDK